MKRLTLLATCCLFSFFSYSQEVWNLRKCVDYALQNNLNIEQSQLSLNNDLLTGNGLKQQRYPSLNANSNFGINFGRTINPATNNFETENSLFNSFGLSSGVALYNGGQVTNNIKQNKIDVNASEADLAQVKNDIALNVALTYLNLLFAYENVTNTQGQLALSQNQLDQIDKLISAGSRPENERYDILAQIATDEQSIIAAQNNVDINLLSLKQAMMLDPSTDIQIEKPDIAVDELEALEAFTLESVFDAASQSQFNIKANELRIQSAEMGVKVAQGQLLPSLNLGGNIGSNWSDLAKLPSGSNTVLVPQQGIFIDGQPIDFAVQTEVPTGFTPIGYTDQLDNNLGYGLSASLNIPIYNRGQAKNNVERAKLSVQGAELGDALAKQQLRTDVQNAIATARAARKSLDASRRAVEASRIAFQNAQKRFDLGALTTFDIISARTRLDSAEINLLIAKYDYLFKNKVIAFYLGRPLTLD